MKGKQRREEPMFACVRLEGLVPENHILRKIDKLIDFSEVQERTEGLYSHTGRPSVDPEVLMRMMVIGYLYGITSERRLCEEVHLNLGYRWFCGLGLEDRVPDHSTFSKNRHGRFAGTELMRDLFYDVTRQAQERGLVGGKHLTIDATTVRANASLESLEPMRLHYTPEEYLEKVERENCEEEDDQPDLPNKGRKLSNQTHFSRTDPDAKIFSRRHEKTKLAYSHNVLMDNSNRVILDVEVTEPNLNQEGRSAGKMAQRSRFVYGIEPETLGGDKAYGTGPAVRGICEAGVAPHVSHPKQRGRHVEGIFIRDDFIYDREKDEIICPAGKRLAKRTTHHRNRQVEYKANKKDCMICELKPQCTRTTHRTACRHLDQDYLDYAASLRKTQEYKISQRCRKKVEMLFAEAKDLMGLRRARRRGYENVLEQSLMTAMVQNIKRIVAWTEDQSKGALDTISCVLRALLGRFSIIQGYMSPLGSQMME